jgi:hypothetical protein
VSINNTQCIDWGIGIGFAVVAVVVVVVIVAVGVVAGAVGESSRCKLLSGKVHMVDREEAVVVASSQLWGPKE